MKRRRIDIVKIFKDGTILRHFLSFDDIYQAEEAVRWLNADELSTRDGLYYMVEEDGD